MTHTPEDSTFKIGPYRVVRHIAQGGMGAVYEVEDPERPGRYALKLAAQATTESSSSTAASPPLARPRGER